MSKLSNYSSRGNGFEISRETLEIHHIFQSVLGKSRKLQTLLSQGNERPTTRHCVRVVWGPKSIVLRASYSFLYNLSSFFHLLEIPRFSKTHKKINTQTFLRKIKTLLFFFPLKRQYWATDKINYTNKKVRASLGSPCRTFPEEHAFALEHPAHPSFCFVCTLLHEDTSHFVMYTDRRIFETFRANEMLQCTQSRAQCIDLVQQNRTVLLSALERIASLFTTVRAAATCFVYSSMASTLACYFWRA